jgi:predicted DNA binding CopG/RHH family protein
MSTERDIKELTEAEIEALADYFDATDATEVMPGDAEVIRADSPEFAEVVVKLPKEDLATLKRRAAASGIGYNTLIRMIIRSHLDNPLVR